MESKVTRQSGIELLRILAALMVIILHYNDGRAFIAVDTGSINQRLLYFMETISICAVDLFLMISGYFLCMTQKRSFLKVLELVIQLQFFRLMFYLLPTIYHGGVISFKTVLRLLIPDDYFIILYCTIYMISPYINIVIRKLSNEQLLKCLILLLSLFSVWNTLLDLFEEIVGKEWYGLSTITRWGSHQGFNIVQFSLMYMIGGFIRCYRFPQSLKKKNVILIWMMSVIIIYIWAILTENCIRHELRSAWDYHNPLVIINATCLLIFFSQLSIKNTIINELAAAAFTCYIVHGAFLNKIDIAKAVQATWNKMIENVIIVIPCLYIISWIMHKIYTIMTRWLFMKLEKIELFAGKEYCNLP